MKRLATYVLGGLALVGVSVSSAHAQAWGPGVQLTYQAGSSHRIEQITGDCDWVVWDEALSDPSGTILPGNPTCSPTVSQTATRADVVGTDTAYSFEHNGEEIFLFGDTIGATSGTGQVNLAPWTTFSNEFDYHAADTMAWSTTQRSEDGLLLNFFQATGANPSHALLVQPMYSTPQTFPDGTVGTALPMGGDEIPNSGISLDGQIYIVASSGTTTVKTTNPDGTTTTQHDHSTDYSVLTKFDAAAQTFAAGRTISQAETGHFVYLAMQEFSLFPNLGFPGFNDDLVAIFGVGSYRHSNIYLSIVSKSNFESGAGTAYYVGTDRFGLPTWALNDDVGAAPVVTDLDPSSPTIGNLSVTYSQQLGLWLMTFDGGRTSSDGAADGPGTAGVYFTYATQPWGPWAKPQLIMNGCNDGALGKFVFYYANGAANKCPSALPASALAGGYPAFSGPAGPTIGAQGPGGNPPFATTGGLYAPEMIARFTEVQGNQLKIFYTLSTWNPYAVVEMESDFTISPQPSWFGWGLPW